jgi:pyrroline-5-carboxylate reductase
LIGAGVTGVYAEPGVNDAGRRSIERILSAGGKVVWVKDESLLDPVTAVSGSGPAYVFYFIEALEEAGIELGLEPAVARTLALETFRGAAELAVRAAEPPSTLRARVTSKGGTTERAISTFDHDKLKEAIHRGVRAANARAGELALQFGKD